MNTPLLILLGCYLLGILGLSIYASYKVENEEDFIVAGRRLPLWLAWGTLLATWFGAATVLGAAEAAREVGVRGTILDPFASGTSLIIAGLFFAKPLWEMKLLTMGDFYGRKYGPRAELVASILLVPGYFGWIGAQFIALGSIQETFFGIPLAWGILIGAAFILFYTMVGGMWSVTLTDTLQLVVLLFGLVVLAITVFSHLGAGSISAGMSRLWQETDADFLNPLPEAGVVAGLIWIGTLGSGFFGNIPGQDLMQRVFASKDSLTAQRACVLAGVAYLLFGLIPVGMGLASILLVPDAKSTGILAILAHEFLSPMLTAVFVISLVSIIVSTATSAVLAPATILGHNLMGRLSFFRSRKLQTDRLAVFLTVTGGVIMAFSGEKIMGLLEISLSIVLVGLFVPLVMGIYGKPQGQLSGMLAILFGGGVWLVRELLEGLILPISETASANEISYPDFIHSEHGWLLYLFVLFPSAITGTLASCVGYYVGHSLDTKSKARVV